MILCICTYTDIGLVDVAPDHFAGHSSTTVTVCHCYMYVYVDKACIYIHIHIMGFVPGCKGQQ